MIDITSIVQATHGTVLRGTKLSYNGYLLILLYTANVTVTRKPHFIKKKGKMKYDSKMNVTISFHTI